jgi:hypothetical protein
MSDMERLHVWDYLLRRSVVVEPENQALCERMAWAALSAEHDAAKLILRVEWERAERMASKGVMAALPQAA